MIDLTKNEKEKDNYIVDISGNYSHIYVVKYANRVEESFPKTEAIRYELLEKLEKQFWDFSKEYKRYAIIAKRNNIIFQGFLFGIIELALLIMEDNISPHIIDNLFVNIIVSFSSVFWLLWVALENISLDEKLNKIHIIEVFLKHKEDFEVVLYKFNNGEDIRYSPIDLNIDNFNSLEEICDFVDEAENAIKLEKIY